MIPNLLWNGLFKILQSEKNVFILALERNIFLHFVRILFIKDESFNQKKTSFNFIFSPWNLIEILQNQNHDHNQGNVVEKDFQILKKI